MLAFQAFGMIDEFMEEFFFLLIWTMLNTCLHGAFSLQVH